MINNITMYLFNHENMLITVLSFKLHIKLFKLSKLKMSLSLFCAIPNSNMTNTLSHTQNLILNQPALIHPESEWFGWGAVQAGLSTHAGNPVCLCAAFSWLGMQSQQAPGRGSWRIPHHTLQPLQTHTEDRPPPPRLNSRGQFLHKASRQTPTQKKPLWYIFWLTIQTQHPWQTRLYQSRTT